MNRAPKILTLVLAGAVLASAAYAQAAPRRIAIEANPQALAEDPNWTEVAEGVWRSQSSEGAPMELAFGEPALIRALDHVERELVSLQHQKPGRGTLGRQLELRRAELELRRNELLEAAPEILAPTRSGGNGPVCWGSATFVHDYGYFSFAQPFVRSTSTYGEFGPLSGGTKTTYASAETCAVGIGCDKPDPEINSIGSGFLVTSQVTATVAPTFCADGEAFGFVLVRSSNGCTDIVCLSTSDSCWP